VRSALRAVVGVAAIGVVLPACNSPEATRLRAGGPGADIGNRNPVLEMHEGSKPYWKTPGRIGKDPGTADVGAASPRAEPR
jgi:hypothetical protein